MILHLKSLLNNFLEGRIIMKTLLTNLLIALISINSNIFSQNIGEFIGYYTHWDFHQNNSPDTYFEMVIINNENDPIPVFVVRNELIYRSDDNTWQKIQPFDSLGFYSLPTMQFCRGGSLDGKILVSNIHMSGATYFSVVDPDNWQYNTYQTSSDTSISSFAYTQEGNIFGNYAGHKSIYKSTDQGQTFSEYIKIGDGDPSVNLSDQLGSDFPIISSANGQYLACIGVVDNATTNGDSIVYMYRSNDFGSNWQGKIIGVKSVYGQIINRNYKSYFNNFPQIAYQIDNNGVVHLAANGYGEGILPGSTDTTEVFPLLYWNSNDEEWISITNPERESPTDAVGRNVGNFFPWNALGNSKPTLSVSQDGKSIFIIWESFEYNNNLTPPMQYNIFNQIGQTQYYYSDILGQVGIYDDALLKFVWENEPLYIQANNNSRSEQNPFAAPSLILKSSSQESFEVNYMYFHDPIPGSYILGQNAMSGDGGWFFNSFVFHTTNIKETETYISDFYLTQNYPNPFNPSTTISWQSSIGSWQTLKVYDVLGREVATIVNEFKPAGNYEVEFDATGFTSGVYYYKLTSQNFSEVKKMILLR